MTGLFLAESILAIHVAIIAFNIAGLLIIPLGAVLRWPFIRIAWLRLLHLALLAIVAGQALAGRACILTIWQNDASGQAPSQPLLMGWVNSLVYWHLPFWVFTVIYSAVFLYVLALSVLVPFGRRR